jgi:hypothetical protein
MSRPTKEGSATATFAARLAALPSTSSVHGSSPLRRPCRESTSRDIAATTIIPSTLTGNNAAVQDVSPYCSTS